MLSDFQKTTQHDSADKGKGVSYSYSYISFYLTQELLDDHINTHFSLF